MEEQSAPKDEVFVSLREFIAFVRRGRPDAATYIFRGQPARRITPDGREFNSFLVPSLYRSVIKRGGSVADLETRLMEDFQREAPAYLQVTLRTEIEWMALVQHHGLPTRLLDWTTNPRRLEAQASCFTLHQLIAFYDKDAYYRHFTEVLPKELNVLKCVVPKSAFSTIKAELAEMAVSHKSLFPGLEGISRTIRYLNSADLVSLYEDWR